MLPLRVLYRLGFGQLKVKQDRRLIEKESPHRIQLPLLYSQTDVSQHPLMACQRIPA